MSMCGVCRLTVNSPEQLQQHMQGKAHKKKMLAAAGLPVEGLKNIPVTGAVAQEQQPGSVKKRKSTEGGSEAGMCSLCNIVFNSTMQAQQHYGGSKHFKRMKIVHGNLEKTQEENKGEAGPTKVMGMLYCGFCKIQVNSQEQLDKHREGAKHKKSLERLKTMAPIKKVTVMPDQTAVNASDVPLTLPSFESYLSTTFVKAKEATQSSMPALDSHLKG